MLDTGAARTTLIEVPPAARQVGEREVSGVLGTERVTEWEVPESAWARCGATASSSTGSTVTATALWDTGAGITVIDQRLADSPPDAVEPADAPLSTDSAGATANTELARIAGYPTIGQARWATHIPSSRWCVER